MKITELLGRKNWIIKTKKGGEVRIIHRKKDFFINHGEATSQCPHDWFVISGNIDNFNPPLSKDNQSIVSVGMGDPSTGLSLLSISLDMSELEHIKSDEFLNKYLDVGKLDKEDCFL